MDGSFHGMRHEHSAPKLGTGTGLAGVRREILLTLLTCCIALAAAWAVHETAIDDASSTTNLMLG